MPESNYPLFEKTVPHYSYLHAGTGNLLNALHDHCKDGKIASNEVAEVTKNMVKLGESSKQEVTQAVRIAEAYYTRFSAGTSHIAEVATKEATAKKALGLLKDACTTRDSLLKFLRKSEESPLKYLFDSKFEHVVYTLPVFRGEKTLDMMLSSSNNSTLVDAMSSDFVVDNRLRHGNSCGHTGYAAVSHAPLQTYTVEKEKTRHVETTTSLWGLRKHQRVVSGVKRTIVKSPLQINGQKMFAVGFLAPLNRLGIRGYSQTAYVIAMPESEYNPFIAKVRKNPRLMEELTKLVHPVYGNETKFQKVVFTETQEERDNFSEEAYQAHEREQKPGA